MGARLHVGRWLEVCVLLLCTPGCSFWAVRGPNGSVAGGGDCSTSVAAPVVDSIFAASFVGLGVAGVASPSCSSGTGGNCFIDFSGAEHGAGAGLIALGVLEAVAATYGAAKVNACHQAKKQLEAISRPLPAPALRTAATGDGATADSRRTVEALPGGPHPEVQHLLDVNALAEARARADRERF